MTLYAKIQNNEIVRRAPRPDWFNDDGSPVSDARLAEDGWLPIIDERPEPEKYQRVTRIGETVNPTHVLVDYDISDWTTEEIVEHEINLVAIERNRRLSLGFDFDFGDARGVHRIGTTPADMIGWDEVTKIALARKAMDVTTPIQLVTDTGPVLVTPSEWLTILEAANGFRQPIWQASFVLQATSPLPSNYQDDVRWP